MLLRRLKGLTAPLSAGAARGRAGLVASAAAASSSSRVPSSSRLFSSTGAREETTQARKGEELREAERAPPEGEKEEGRSFATSVVLALSLLGGGMLTSMLLQGNAQAKGEKKAVLDASQAGEIIPDAGSPDDALYGAASFLLPEDEPHPLSASKRSKRFADDWEVASSELSAEQKKELELVKIGSSGGSGSAGRFSLPPHFAYLQHRGVPFPGNDDDDTLPFNKAFEDAANTHPFNLTKTYFALLWASVMGAVAFSIPSLRVFEWMRRHFTSGPSTLRDPALSLTQKASRLFLSSFGANGFQALFGLVMAHCFLEPLILESEAISIYLLPPLHAATSANELLAVFLTTGFLSSFFTAATGRALNDLRPPSTRGLSPAVFGSFAYFAMKYPETPITFLFVSAPALLWVYAVTFPHVLLTTVSMMKPAITNWRFKGNPAAVAFAASLMNREAIANTTGITTGILGFFVTHYGRVPVITGFEAPSRVAYSRGSASSAALEGGERSAHGQRGQRPGEPEAQDVEGASPADVASRGGSGGANDREGPIDVVTGRRVSGGAGMRRERSVSPPRGTSV